MVPDADADMGMGGLKPAKYGQEQKAQGGLTGPHGQHPLVQAGYHLQFLLCSLELFHRDLHMGIETFSLWCQRDPPVGTDQQRTAEGMLHEPDDAGQIRLVVVEDFSGGRKVFVSGNMIEDAVVFVADVHGSSFL